MNNEARRWPQNEVLGFGNSLTHQPLQKVKRGKEKFREVLKQPDQSKEKLVKNLNELLSDREKHWPDDELYRRAPNWANQLSSICTGVPTAAYGSRYVHGINKRDKFNKFWFNFQNENSHFN